MGRYWRLCRWYGFAHRTVHIIASSAYGGAGGESREVRGFASVQIVHMLAKEPTRSKAGVEMAVMARDTSLGDACSAATD